MGAFLSVRRQSPEDAGHRQVVLSLDGDRWVTLLHGQAARREVPAGRHVLKADNTLMKRSIAFELAEGEEARFAVVNRAGFGTWFFMLLGSPLLYLTLRRE